MRGNNMGAAITATPRRVNEPSVPAKVGNEKDICKVFEFFQYKTGTSLDCALSIGVLRNSITWYVDALEKMGLLKAVAIRPDRTTGYKAKYYTADKSLWPGITNEPQQLCLFGKEAFNE